MLIADFHLQGFQRDALSGPSSHFTYTSNLAGVFLADPPKKQRFSATKANITLPHFTDYKSTKESSSDEKSVSVWIGIDYSLDNPAGIRTGLSFTTQSDGQILPQAFHQWGLDGPSQFTNLGSLTAGDKLQLEVVMFNESFAKAEIENFSTGKKATKYWKTPPESGAELSGQVTGWVLEDQGATCSGQDSFLFHKPVSFRLWKSHIGRLHCMD